MVLSTRRCWCDVIKRTFSVCLHQYSATLMSKALNVPSWRFCKKSSLKDIKVLYSWWYHNTATRKSTVWYLWYLYFRAEVWTLKKLRVKFSLLSFGLFCFPGLSLSTLSEIKVLSSTFHLLLVWYHETYTFITCSLYVLAVNVYVV